MPIAGCGSASTSARASTSVSTSVSDIDRPKCLNCRVRAGRVGRNGSRGLCNACYSRVRIRKRFARGKKPRRVIVAACVHCSQVRQVRCRRLCSTCHADLKIRVRYPVLRGHGGRDLVRPTPRRLGPTTALPGSDEKIRLMAARAAANVPLFHPFDATFAGAGGDSESPIDLSLFGDFAPRPVRVPRRHKVGT